MLELITGWACVGIIISILIGIGIGVLSMSPPEFTIAKTCFTVAALILLVKVGWWVAFDASASAVSERIFVCFLIFGITGVGWAESVIWIASRQRNATTPSPEILQVSEHPNFHIKLVGSWVLNTDQKDSVIVGVMGGVSNSGSTGTVSDISLDLQVGSRLVHGEFPLAPNKDDVMNLKRPGEDVGQLRGKDFFAYLLTNPIQANGNAIGWTMATFNGVTKDEVMGGEAVITMTCTDATGRRYSGDRKLDYSKQFHTLRMGDIKSHP